jgi:uncharacterized protein HemX
MSDDRELQEQPETTAPDHETKAPDPETPPPPAPAPEPSIRLAPPAPTPDRKKEKEPRSMVRMLVVAGVVLVIGACVVAWLLSRSESKMREFIIKKVAEV